MRADARRNLDLILSAARIEIRQHGPEVSMIAIAKRAGLANGTLYRHFPTKEVLVEAVLVAFSAEIVQRAEVAADGIAAPGDAIRLLEEFLTQFVVDAAANPGLKAAANEVNAAFMSPELEQRGLRALQTIVESAQRDNDLRPFVRASDVFLLMLAAPTKFDESNRARWIDVTLSGLRT